MQQVPKSEQGVFGRITAAMGASYTLHEPQALRDALRRGAAQVFHPAKAGPFYLNLPINTQPATVRLRLDALPERPRHAPLAPVDDSELAMAARLVAECPKVAIKAGGGSRCAADALRRF